VITYGGRAVELWWQGAEARLARQDRLAVTEIPLASTRELAGMVDRFMRLQVTIQDDHVLVTDGAASVGVEPVRRKTRAT
jgi:uncharacterized protein YaeQ